MQALLEVILPVFLVIGFGYLAVWRGWFSTEGVEALMKFTQNFAIPVLLFMAIATLDLGQHFDARLLLSYYTGATAGFLLGLFGARLIFGRPWEDSVAIGFLGLFSNAVLLGLPITERAYGEAALAGNYAIIALNAPWCYGLGMTVMEIVRNRGGRPRDMAARVLRAMFRNALLIGIAAGFFVNLTGLPLPGIVWDAAGLVSRAALPAALFGLGGVLVAYRPEGDLRIVLYMTVVALAVTPAIVWSMGKATGLPTEAFRSAVLTSTMAPGVNGYVFANMYGVGKRVAATTVLIATAISILTIWLWLLVLP
ncbi:AEC family transporter [Ovoidimarina sediminis]|uniref:AEC family transporter n=1 Tax=Ovoidimarina sediminis TaxID=3079856 RepID=UPI002906D698|nr:AEC family transporter [Rhodophyticola sp. MJ-SS7]MDU8946189.1 AEC family transporter [Rhodophyticola sp. MJ-SS7]